MEFDAGLHQLEFRRFARADTGADQFDEIFDRFEIVLCKLCVLLREEQLIKRPFDFGRNRHVSFFYAGKSARNPGVGRTLPRYPFPHPLQRLLYCNGPFGDGNTGSRITNRPATGRTAERGIQIGAGRNPLALALRKNRLGTVHHRIVLKRKLYDVT